MKAERQVLTEAGVTSGDCTTVDYCKAIANRYFGNYSRLLRLSALQAPAVTSLRFSHGLGLGKHDLTGLSSCSVVLVKRLVASPACLLRWKLQARRQNATQVLQQVSLLLRAEAYAGATCFFSKPALSGFQLAEGV